MYVHEQGRTYAIIAQANKARLCETSRDSKPSFVRASRPGKCISPKREIEGWKGLARASRLGEEPMVWATEHLAQARGTRLSEKL